MGFINVTEYAILVAVDCVPILESYLVPAVLTNDTSSVQILLKLALELVERNMMTVIIPVHLNVIKDHVHLVKCRLKRNVIVQLIQDHCLVAKSSDVRLNVEVSDLVANMDVEENVVMGTVLHVRNCVISLYNAAAINVL